jgi:hypothetical protein
MKQKNPSSIGSRDARRHGGRRLAGRQSNMKYLPPPLPNHRIVIGSEAQEIHLCSEFAQAS